MIRHPGYSTAALVMGVLNMSNVVAVLFALTVLISGFVTIFFSLLIGCALLALAVWILVDQFCSRFSHVRAIRALRIKRGRLEVRVAENDWRADVVILDVAAEDFPYADPWRPFTLGYPGIRLRVRSSGREFLVEDIFAYGMAPARDDVVQFLQTERLD